MSPVGSHPLSACFWFLDEGADNSFSSFSGFRIWPCLPLRVYRQPPQPHCSLSEAFADELPSLGHTFLFLSLSIPPNTWTPPWCSGSQLWVILPHSQLTGSVDGCCWHRMGRGQAAAADCTLHRTAPHNKNLSGPRCQ